MAVTSDLGKPLLDVEAGQRDIPQEPSAEENAKLLQEGMMSWKDLAEFFMNPSHWVVTALVGYSLVCIIGLLYLFIDLGNFDLNHNIGMVAFLAVAGLAASAYNAFLSVQLKEEVNKFWRLNQELKSNKVRLEHTCKTLRENVGKMKEEADQFQKLKDNMQSFADKLGSGFSEVFNKASDILENMKTQLSSSQSNLLAGYAAKMEYLDGEEGMTEEEFSTFKERLPKEYQDVTFASISSGQSTASVDQVQALIDQVCQSLKEK